MELVHGLVKEMSLLFPDPYFHTGADEVNANCWSSAPSIQSYMMEHNIQNPYELLQTFEDEVTGLLTNLNKTMVLWEESLLEYNVKLDPSVVIQVWKGSENTKKVAEKGHQMIVSSVNYWYLDCGKGSWISGGTSWCDPYKTWVDIYNYHPDDGLSEEERKLVLGGEVALWSEIVNPSTLDGSLWPRVAAAGERLWSEPSQTDNPENARGRLFSFVSQLELMGIGYTPFQPEWCSKNLASCKLMGY
jgi:hexosaminidase